jgi:hypothetical protein
MTMEGKAVVDIIMWLKRKNKCARKNCLKERRGQPAGTVPNHQRRISREVYRTTPPLLGRLNLLRLPLPQANGDDLSHIRYSSRV